MDRGYGIQLYPGPGPRGGFIEHVGGHGGGWPDGLSWVIFALLLALLLVAIASLALDAYYRSNGSTGGLRPTAGSLAVLDLRYARGEVDRESYLQARSDLSGVEATTLVLPARQEPAEGADKPEG